MLLEDFQHLAMADVFQIHAKLDGIPHAHSHAHSPCPLPFSCFLSLLHNFRQLAQAGQPSVDVQYSTCSEHRSKIAGTENNMMTPYADSRQASLAYAVLH